MVRTLKLPLMGARVQSCKPRGKTNKTKPQEPKQIKTRDREATQKVIQTLVTINRVISCLKIFIKCEFRANLPLYNEHRK